jgi:hypothetical protein
VARRPWAKRDNLESAISDCSSQAARTPGIALVSTL